MCLYIHRYIGDRRDPAYSIEGKGGFILWMKPTPTSVAVEMPCKPLEKGMKGGRNDVHDEDKKEKGERIGMRSEARLSREAMG